MKATDLLLAEHKEIQRLADVIERICERLEHGGEVPARHLGWVLDFIAQFTDTVHHEKEEEILFPRMRRVGLSESDAIVTAALDDHGTAREQVRSMNEAVRWYKEGYAEAAAAFVRHARTYMYLLRHHIAVEDTVIFPKADGILDAAAQEEMAAECETLEEDRLDAGRREQLFFRLGRLVEIYCETRNA